MVYLLLVIALFLAIPQPGQAEIINVPDDHETIQRAINAAEDGDIVLVQPGRYVGQISFAGKAITVASLYLTEEDDDFITRTIIDADATEDDQAGTVRFENDETDESVLIGFTVMGGVTNYGGGIYCRGTNPVIDHCIITANMATRYGGGVYCTSGAHPTFRNVTISGNFADTDRGAIHVFNNGTGDFINCIVWGNEPAEPPEELNFSYSDVQVEGDVYPGDENINDDPEFLEPIEDFNVIEIEPDDFDFHLGEGSPCVNTGDPESPRDEDGSLADMGALHQPQVPRIRVDPEEVDFGEEHLGFFSARTVEIINSGGARLTVDIIVLLEEGSPFEIIEGGGEEVELNPGERHDVIIRFTPEEVGDEENVLHIESDAENFDEVNVPLTAVGLPPIPNIVIEAERFDFGESPLYENTDIILEIANTGLEVLNVANIEIRGENAENFSTDFDGAFEVEPEGMTEITVSYYPVVEGDAVAELFLECDDPDEPEFNFPMSGTGVLPPRHFEFTDNTGVNLSALVRSATFNGEDLGYGCEIGVFTPDGLCSGGDMWIGEELGFAVWGDNVITDEVDGFVDDERMEFRIWNLPTHEEVVADVDYIRGEAVYQDNGIVVVELSGEGEGGVGDEPFEFTIEMAEGWNMVSAPVIPDDDDVRAVWAPLVEEEQLVLLKDHDGRFYHPGFDFNNIPFWDFRYGYQAKVTEDCELTITGEEAPVDTPIPLGDSWAIVAYFPEQDIRERVAFANIVDVLAIAKDALGRFYNVEFDFSNMAPLTRGQGYQLRTTDEIELVWNVPDRAASVGVPEIVTEPLHFDAPRKTDRNMSLLITDLGDLATGSEIGVFNSEGNCIGAQAINGEGPWGLPVWGDDPSTEIVDGALDDEAFTIKVWNGKAVETHPIWLQGSGVYRADDFAAVSLSSSEAIPREFTIADPYPNPFNSTTHIRYALAEDANIRLAVLDLNGREIAVIQQGRQPAGWHSASFSATDLSSGVYLMRMTGAPVELTKKIVLVR